MYFSYKRIQWQSELYLTLSVQEVAQSNIITRIFWQHLSINTEDKKVSAFATTNDDDHLDTISTSGSHNQPANHMRLSILPI